MLDVRTYARASMTTVECFASHGPKQQLEAWSYDIASETPPGHVDVAITHCGICHSDLHQLDDAWGIATFPLVPGHEIVGQVVATGDGVPESLAVGTRVGIGPQRSHCKDCGPCRAKREHLCPRKGKTCVCRMPSSLPPSVPRPALPAV